MAQGGSPADGVRESRSDMIGPKEEDRDTSSGHEIRGSISAPTQIDGLRSRGRPNTNSQCETERNGVRGANLNYWNVKNYPIGPNDSDTETDESSSEYEPDIDTKKPLRQMIAESCQRAQEYIVEPGNLIWWMDFGMICIGILIFTAIACAILVTFFPQKKTPKSIWDCIGLMFK